MSGTFKIEEYEVTFGIRTKLEGGNRITQQSRVVTPVPPVTAPKTCAEMSLILESLGIPVEVFTMKSLDQARTNCTKFSTLV
jgi:hypothetical protein